MRPEDVIDQAGYVQVDLSRNEKQKAFLLDPRRFLLYSGGFGSGKTTICNLRGLVLSCMVPNNMGVVLRQTYRDLHETTRENFLSICPSDWIKSWRESEDALTLKNNSTILFRYFENKKIKVGGNWGWFFIDQAEEADKEIFLACKGRLRRMLRVEGGYAPTYGMMAMNPNGKDWQYKMFVENPEPDYGCYESSSHENRHNLADDYIESLLSSYSQEWVDRFVLGKWTTMSGLILHEFDRQKHVIDPFVIPREWPKGRGLDWGVDAPATAVHLTYDQAHGVYYVFNCYGDREKTAEEHARAIIEQSKVFGPYRGNVLDKSAFHREKDLKSVADKYQASGLVVQPATGDMLASVMHLKWLLKTGRLKFFRGVCDPLFEEMESWKWGARQAGKEVPARGNDHYIDSLRYICYWFHRRFGVRAVSEDGKPEKMRAKLTIGESQPEVDSVTGMPA